MSEFKVAGEAKAEKAATTVVVTLKKNLMLFLGTIGKAGGQDPAYQSL